jgi:hypothetical protein
MALIHEATLTPGKLELLAAWLPGQSWAGDVTGLRRLGAYRFDDPAGEVGIETFLLATGDERVLQVPLTYRGAELPGAEAHLVGTTEHSVLGKRWVYDGCGDPVWAAELAATVLAGGTEVAELVDSGDGDPQPRLPSVTVQGNGTPGTPVPAIDAVSSGDEGPVTVVGAGAFELVVARVVGTEIATPNVLVGRWADAGPVVLAGIREV